MKIKKKTSFMMLAASTAAVIGVAAVSYAAWQGTYTELTASANTGEAYLFGFAEDQSNNLLSFGTQKLVPFDQGDSAYDDTATVIVSDAIPDFTVYQNYTITLDGLTMLKDGVQVTSEFSVYAQVGTFTVDSKPVIAADWSAENSGDWKLISDSDGFDFELEFADNNNVQELAIALMLVSNVTDEAATQQMGATISFNVTLVDSGWTTE